MMHSKSRVLAVAALVVVIVLGIIPPSPANALTDLADSPPAGWTAAGIMQNGCNPCNYVVDGSDSTHDEAIGLTPTHALAVRWATTGAGGNFDILSFRGLFGACNTGWPTYVPCGTAVAITRIVVTCMETSTVVYDSGTVSLTGQIDTGQVDFTSPCTITGPGVADNDDIEVKLTKGAGSDVVVWALQMFAEGTGPEEVLITEYLYGLRLDHPPFERVIYWEWAIDDCGGSWSIVDEDDDVFGGDFLNCAGDFVGQYERFVIECPVVCGHDVYLITINDTTNNRVAHYEIDSDESGVLIADSTPPVITSYTACYNASTDQCVGLRADLYTAQAAGTLQITYSFTGDPANVTIGQDDITQGLWYMDGGGDTVDAQVEGWYRVTDTTVNEAASPTFNIYLENFATEYAWRQVTVDFGAGGHEEIPPADPDPDEGEIRDCVGQGALDLGLVACRIGQLVDVLTGVFASVVHNLWGPAIHAMRGAAAEKLPFAYVVLALDGVNDQIERAALEVESSDDCEGVVLTVPLYYGSSNLSASPSPFPITVLNCAGLEPTMGSDWYQAVRVMLDPALWILFGWSQIKALQPKTSLNG